MKREISIIGAPMDLGQARRGVDMGPSAIRCAGLSERLQRLGYEVYDEGDIEIEIRERAKSTSSTHLKNLEAVAEGNQRLCTKIQEVISLGRFPLVVGGDHSIAIGTLAGVSKRAENLGVIWYDAHGDLNTAETSPSGNIHGMPLAVSLGMGHPLLTNIGGYLPKVKPENIVIIGARSLDVGEKELIREKGIRVYTMHEIDRLGMTKVMEEAVSYLKERTDHVHLSLDLDGLDPKEAPGVGTPVVGGISYRESHLAMEMLAEANFITSAEFVEINPILDDLNRTAEVAVALVGSLLGENLLFEQKNLLTLTSS
ncbi:arginase [Priestia endophytica]|uniref:Arginase n=1 Tax=Priestia endophytica DSM 13796 TaxID=1121089 RepID=A0A1I6AX98_9BACI|nr:arginase [Priestia endophytica]KYG31237.1 arginase [Priestia endophytica]SFQ73263.1 arginase [Priestia endophytica DSM 13796]